MEARILLENNMESMVQEIRREDPGIGAYKLFLMLKDIYGKRMFGRDRFYKFLHQKHLMLPAQKRRHTTNSNHNYRKYKNQIKGINRMASTSYGLQTLLILIQTAVFVTFIY